MLDAFKEDFQEWSNTPLEIWRTKCTFRQSISKENPRLEGTFEVDNAAQILGGFMAFQEGYPTSAQLIGEDLHVTLSHNGGREAFIFKKA